MDQNAKRRNCRYGVIVAVCLLVAAGANAQDLDSASQAYDGIRMLMGYQAYTNMDTTTDAKLALNLGMRAVEQDLKFLVRDSLNIHSDSFHYPLPHTFRPSREELDEVERAFHVYYRAKNMKTYVGLKHGPPESVVQKDGDVLMVTGWNLEDSILHVAYSQGAGGQLFIVGLGRVTPVTDGSSSLSPIPEGLRWAAVWYAVGSLLFSVDAQRHMLAMNEYERFRPKADAALRRIEP